MMNYGSLFEEKVDYKEVEGVNELECRLLIDMRY